MKKSIYFIIIRSLMIMLFGYGQKNNKLENMTTQSNGDYISIIWGERIYVPFYIINNSE